MYKLVVRSLLALILGLYILLLGLVPIKLYKLNLIGVFGEIFPAIDIIIIYYFSSYTNVRYWILFIIGIIIDQIYQIPIGSSAFAFITANIILAYANKWFILKDDTTNLLIFCIYSFFVISFRVMIFLIKNDSLAFDLLF